jgi:hypothetical protein
MSAQSACVASDVAQAHFSTTPEPFSQDGGMTVRAAMGKAHLGTPMDLFTQASFATANGKVTARAFIPTAANSTEHGEMIPDVTGRAHAGTATAAATLGSSAAARGTDTALAFTPIKARLKALGATTCDATDTVHLSFPARIPTPANSVIRNGTDTGLATIPTVTRLKALGSMTHAAKDAGSIITMTAAFTLANFSSLRATGTACELRLTPFLLFFPPFSPCFCKILLRPFNTPHGHFISCVYPNGFRFEGSWFQDLYHGSGRCFNDARCLYDGQWQRGKMNGPGTFLLADGSTFSCAEWVDDFVSECSCQRKFADGQPCRFNYTDHFDSKNGRMRRRWEDGICYENFWRQELLAIKKPQKCAAAGGRMGQSVGDSRAGQMVNFRGKLIVIPDAGQVRTRESWHLAEISVA